MRLGPVSMARPGGIGASPVVEAGLRRAGCVLPGRASGWLRLARIHGWESAVALRLATKWNMRWRCRHCRSLRRKQTIITTGSQP